MAVDHQLHDLPEPPRDGRLIALELCGMVVLTANEWSLCQVGLERAAREEEARTPGGDLVAANLREVARRVEARRAR